ncbi:MAG: lipid A export permease/ATP-binding protein MsbA [Pseudomonadota bacterium]
MDNTWAQSPITYNAPHQRIQGATQAFMGHEGDKGYRLEGEAKQSPYRRLLGYVAPLWPAFLLSMVGFVLYAITQASFAGLMDYLPTAFEDPTTGMRGGDRRLSAWELELGLDSADRVRLFLPLALVAIVSVRGIGSYLGGYYITYVARRVVNRLRAQVFEHINYLPAAYLSQKNSAELLSLITFNIEQVASAASTAIKIIVREGLTVAVLFIYILYLNWKLSLLFVGLAPLIGLIIGLASRQFKKYSRRIQDSMGGITQVAAEAIRGFTVVRGYGGIDGEIARFDDRNDYTLRQDMKLARVNEVSTPVIQWLTYSALALLFWFGLDPSLRGAMDTGEFLAYITAASMIAKPLRQLTQVNVRIQRGIAAAESVFEILDEIRERADGLPLTERLAGNVQIRNLSFRYPGSEQDTLRDISIDIRAGETVALVGRSGSGKTTLASVLAALYPPTSGDVLIDGQSIRELKLEDLRRQISLVSQRPMLFATSVHDNIAYGALADASDSQVFEALRQANASGFVDALPDGVNTVLKEEGDDVSGGERQRLALARAFLNDAPVLILDEATSAQDTESEALIQQSLQRILAGRTAIIVAHRLKTIQNADRILVMDEGQIVEQGSHNDLLELSGLYAALSRGGLSSPS